MKKRNVLIDLTIVASILLAVFMYAMSIYVCDNSNKQDIKDSRVCKMHAN